MRDLSDLPGVPGTGAASRRLSWPLSAVRVPSGQLAGRPPGALRGPAGLAPDRPGPARRAGRHSAGARPGRVRGGPGRRAGNRIPGVLALAGKSDAGGGRHGRPDTLVCVGPRAIRPSGAGPFGGARAIGSAGERLVHTEEVTGSIPVSPTSTKSGVRPDQKLYRTDLIVPGGWGLPPCWEEFWEITFRAGLPAGVVWSPGSHCSLR
jgi:hypothetical protein